MQSASRSARAPRRRDRFVSIAMILIVLITLLLLSACGHPKQARVNVPPPPPPASTTNRRHPSRGKPPGHERQCSTQVQRRSDTDADLAEPTLPADAQPLATETGLASWYGPPYHNRRGSNGEVYNMHAMTAAHRTYPLGSIVRVTNVKTGPAALVRITDRGPFIPGRVVDLSLAAAHKLDVWKPGVAQVKVELMQLRRGSRGARKMGGADRRIPRRRRRQEDSPITCSAAITRPRSCVLTAPPATGGCASAFSTTITNAPKN